MSSPSKEFLRELDGFFAAYLDGAGGFQLFRQRLEEAQLAASSSMGKSIAELDERTFFYGEGEPDSPGSRVLLRVTQGTVKTRNEKDGENSVFLSRMLIVAIYQLWEDHYRALIAARIGIPKNQLKSDLFGDIRRYRQSIVHNQGIATAEVGGNRVLRWFEIGQSIAPTQQQMNGLLFQLHDELEGMNVSKPRPEL